MPDTFASVYVFEDEVYLHLRLDGDRDEDDVFLTTFAALDEHRALVLAKRTRSLFEAAIERDTTNLAALSRYNSNGGDTCFECVLSRRALSSRSQILYDIITSFYDRAVTLPSVSNKKTAYAFEESIARILLSQELETQTYITALCAIFNAAIARAEREEANLYFADGFLASVLRRKCGLALWSASNWLYGHKDNTDWEIDDSDE